LDGLPLAIELAAARTKLFPPEVLLPRLTARLTLLTDGPRDWPARQRTLRATLDWSYDLLPPDARALFACLGVFSGPFDAGAAAAVCADGERDIRDGPTEDQDGAAAVLLERLAALTDQSLLEVTPGSTPRFHLLETVREYALARLAETGQQEAMRDRHLHYYLSVAEEAEQALRGPEAAGWMSRLEAEHDNLRAALAWAREGGALVPGLRLAGALQRFWEVAGQLSEGRIWLEGLLAATGARPAAGVAAARATALNGAGNLARGQGRYAEAQALIEESLALQRSLGNRAGVGYALFRLALVLRERGDYPAATALYEECRTLYQTLGDRAAVAYVLLGLGDIARDQGDAAEVERYCGASLRICRELGRHWASGFSLNNLALAAAMRGDLVAAHALAEEALALFRVQGIQGGVAEMLIGIGQLECDQGAFEQARATLAQGLARSWPAGPQWLVAAGLEEMARVALAQDQAALVARLCGAAAAWRGVMSAPLPPYRRATYARTVAAARVALGEDNFAAAWLAGEALRPEQAVAEASATGG
ncbi:MAG TPA: tetratricopeptide repeat protein, partial [Chloroflexota bacterium]|nr:tetratricopeptide repeat protein [Chloroflexota bacterium]